MKQFGVETRVIVVDANNTTHQTFTDVQQECQDLDLGILINNVGLNTPYPASLCDTSVELVDNMIEVNARFPTHLTRALIPVLKKRKNSAIVNVSSMSCVLPGALLAVYAATKSYNNIFSKSMSAELEPFGIEVLAVTPGYVLSAR